MTDSKPDPLHPTGRHPEGGCGCAGEPDDPPCEFHAPGNDGDELDVTPVDVPTNIDTSVRQNMLLIERYKAEVRRLRDRIYSHDGVVECQRADEAEAEADRLRTANDALRAAAWELLVTTECEVITVSEPGARERFEAAKLQLRNWFCKPAASTSDENPGKARIEADGGEHVAWALSIVEDQADPSWSSSVLAAEVRRQRDQLIVRDMQVSTLKELREQAEAKSDDLRRRWDRVQTEAESLRADNEALRLKDDQSYAAIQRFGADNERLRETIRVMSENEGKLQARIAELETKLARVEALPKHWRATSGDKSRAWECAENLEAALRDDQPIGP